MQQRTETDHMITFFNSFVASKQSQPGLQPHRSLEVGNVPERAASFNTNRKVRRDHYGADWVVNMLVSQKRFHGKFRSHLGSIQRLVQRPCEFHVPLCGYKAHNNRNNALVFSGDHQSAEPVKDLTVFGCFKAILLFHGRQGFEFQWLVLAQI